LSIGFLLHWWIGTRDRVFWCWRDVLPILQWDEWNSLSIGFILHRWVGTRDRVFWCWRDVLPILQWDEWNSVSIGFILHWPVSTCVAMLDSKPGVILRTSQRHRRWHPLPVGFILRRWIGTRGCVHWRGGNLLSCVVFNEWNPLPIWLILHWRIGASGAGRRPGGPRGTRGPLHCHRWGRVEHSLLVCTMELDRWRVHVGWCHVQQRQDTRD
jgi:hypothetical protein